MAMVESEQGHEAIILPFPGPRVRQELVTSRELRRRVREAGFVSVRYRAGPRHFGFVVVSKAEVLRQLDQYPAEALHHLETKRDDIVLGA